MDKALNKAAPSLSPGEQRCLELFRSHVRTICSLETGIHDTVLADRVADDWFFCDERHAHRFSEIKQRLPGAKRILDLSSGMGTAVLYGLSQGFNCFGIEPDPIKLRLTGERIRAGGMPADWGSRFVRGVGESLPFQDGVFEVVSSYQTLEHVQNQKWVIGEMLRVVKSGGALHIRCPDYSGTFEGHYLLPWLPLMPRPLARAYLRLLRRPLAGFEGVRYTTRRGILRLLRWAQNEIPGLDLKMVDLGKERFARRLREKKLPAWDRAYALWKILGYFRGMFRRESEVNLWVSVKKGV